MEKLKTPLVILTIAFSISFLDGVFSWGLSDDLYILLGAVEIVCIVWLLRIVFKKQQ